eukprot:368934-Rhodomonas_salina.1
MTQARDRRRGCCLSMKPAEHSQSNPGWQFPGSTICDVCAHASDVRPLAGVHVSYCLGQYLPEMCAQTATTPGTDRVHGQRLARVGFRTWRLGLNAKAK